MNRNMIGIYDSSRLISMIEHDRGLSATWKLAVHIVNSYAHADGGGRSQGLVSYR